MSATYCLPARDSESLQEGMETSEQMSLAALSGLLTLESLEEC